MEVSSKIFSIMKPINCVLREKDKTSFAMNSKVPTSKCNENHLILLYGDLEKGLRSTISFQLIGVKQQVLCFDVSIRAINLSKIHEDIDLVKCYLCVEED